MKRFSLLGFTVLLLVACKGGGGGGGAAAPSKYAGTEDGLRQLLTDIRKPEVDANAMTKSLRPTPEDYKAVFEPGAIDRVQKAYDLLWTDTEAKIGADPANTEIKIWQTTSDDIRAWTGEAKTGFPGGYQKAGPHLKPGMTWWRWKYTKPGEDLGMAYDGLVFVNGHWAWFPRPHRALAE